MRKISIYTNYSNQIIWKNFQKFHHIYIFKGNNLQYHVFLIRVPRYFWTRRIRSDFRDATRLLRSCINGFLRMHLYTVISCRKRSQKYQNSPITLLNSPKISKFLQNSLKNTGTTMESQKLGCFWYFYW